MVGKFLARPEVVKSERCGDQVCNDCQHKTDEGCWHGIKNAYGYGDMAVNVKANSPFTSFAQDIFVGCLTTSGRWFVRVRSIFNGKIAIYRNNKLVTEVMQVSGRSKDVDLTIPPGTKARIRTVFVPTNRDSPSSGVVQVQTEKADASVDRCMTTNLCMAKLGDGSEAGFEIRNNNGMQYKCLTSGANSLLSDLLKDGSDLRSTCSAWVGCMPQVSVDILKVLLAVSGVLGSGSFADKGNFTASADPNACIDPAVEDPESWDCECFQEMKESCQDEGDEKACFKKILCDNAAVCASWKAEQCSSLLQRSQTTEHDAALGNIEDTLTGDLDAVLGQRSQEHASSGIDGALDASLKGKCTSETQ